VLQNPLSTTSSKGDLPFGIVQQLIRRPGHVGRKIMPVRDQMPDVLEVSKLTNVAAIVRGSISNRILRANNEADGQPQRPISIESDRLIWGKIDHELNSFSERDDRFLPIRFLEPFVQAQPSGDGKYISKTGQLGFHAAYYMDDEGKNMPSAIANAIIGAYLGKLGYSYDFAALITSAPPEAMLWISANELRKMEVPFFVVEEVENGTAPKRQ